MKNLLKSIPKDWFYEVMILNLEKTKLKFLHVDTNKSTKTINLYFLNDNERDNYYNEMYKSFLTTLNQYIKDKEENIKDYNRNIIFTTDLSTTNKIIISI